MSNWFAIISEKLNTLLNRPAPAPTLDRNLR